MTVKIKRMNALSKVGQHREISRQLQDHMADDLFEQLTGKQLALVMDALYSCSQQSKAMHELAICDEGVIWDDKQQKLRELN